MQAKRTFSSLWFSRQSTAACSKAECALVATPCPPLPLLRRALPGPNSGPARDHIHLLVCLPPDVAIAAFIGDAKSMSGRLINAQRQTTGSPFWGAGYFAKTVGRGSLESARRYVVEQWNEDAARTTPPDPEATVLKD